MLHMQAGQDDALPALSAPQAGVEATLTETTCEGKATTDEGKREMGDAGRTDLPGLVTLWCKVR